PEPVGFSGAIAARPFKTKDGKPVEVKSGAELEAQLKKLKPGQLAVVDFGADWCVPCAAYRPTFEKISREAAGKFLMIRAQGIKGSEDDWGRYGIKEFPTVAFIDSNGKVTPVSQIDDPLDSLLLAALHSPVDQLKLLSSRLESGDVQERQRGLKGLQALGLKAAPALPEVMKLLRDPEEVIRFEACLALANMGPAAAPAVPELVKMLGKDRPPPRLAAVEALSAIGLAAKPAIPALLQAIRSPALAEAEAWERERGTSAELAKFNAVEWTFELSRMAALALSSIDPGNSGLQKKLLTIAEDSALSTESRIAALLGLEKFEMTSPELTLSVANLWDSIRALRNADRAIRPPPNPSRKPEAPRLNRASFGGLFFGRESRIGGGAELGLGRQIPGGPELRLKLGVAGAAAVIDAKPSDVELRASVGGAWAFGDEEAEVRPAILLPEVGIAHRVDAKETAFHGSPLGLALQVRIGEAWRFEAGARATMDYAERLELGGESSLSFIRKF
ncbi:MAG TPA: HEAT repeat domain-containing protein, partial [bacterium]|nr:HEAT repeat domain-containing protein [bacterium]